MLGEVEVYDDHRELLAEKARDLDFIDIAGPPNCHAEIACAALASGLHVLCETPLAISVGEARSMVGAALGAGRVLFPCHAHKHVPLVQLVRSMRRTAVIGKVKLVTVQLFRARHPRGVAEWRPDWRRERRYAGGGVGMDIGSHAFGLAFEWLGSYPTSVSATSTRLGTSDTEDCLSATLVFPTGLATVQLTWTAGAEKSQYTLHGERGAITVDGGRVELLLPPQAEGLLETRPEVDISTLEMVSSDEEEGERPWFEAILDEFVTAIRTEDFVSRETRDALSCAAVMDAAYESTVQRSREVPIADPSTPPYPKGWAGRSHLKLARNAPDEC
jgi:myo-inositol 2-dehydrogenase / D-chiro-inositol 1-dehydrogenase